MSVDIKMSKGNVLASPIISTNEGDTWKVNSIKGKRNVI